MREHLPFGRLTLSITSLCNAVVVSIGTFLLATIGRSRIFGTDYTAFATGWRLALNDPSNLYNLDVQGVVQRQFGGSYEGGVLPFNYPPFVASMFAALGRSDLVTGYRIWMAFNVVLVGLLLVLLKRLAGFTNFSEIALLLLSAAAFGPIWAGIIGGTMALWLGVGVAGFCVALIDDREIAAGLWLCVVAVKPQYLPLLVLVLLLRRKWKALASATVGGLGLIGLSSALLGFNSWMGFAKVLGAFGSAGSQNNAHAELMWSLRGLLTRLFTGHTLSASASPIWFSGRNETLVSVLSLALFICSALTVIWFRQVPVAVHIGLTIALSMVTSLHGHVHDAVILLVPVCLWMGWATKANREADADPTRLRWIRRFAVVCVGAGPLLFFGWFFLRSPLSLAGVAFGLFVTALMLIEANSGSIKPALA